MIEEEFFFIKYLEEGRRYRISLNSFAFIANLANIAHNLKRISFLKVYPNLNSKSDGM